MATILDGKKLANQLNEKLKQKIEALKVKGIQPTFAVINIGDNAANKVYIRSKVNNANKLGIQIKNYDFPENTKQSQVVALIKQLNADPEMNGIMVQSPVSKTCNFDELVDLIDPEKDIDALNAVNIGRLWRGDYFVKPATASGIMSLLAHYDVDLTGKNAVIVGRSNIVGKPMAALLLEANATVSFLHTKTDDLAKHTKRADILIAAAGQPHLIKADMVKQGAIVIDVGINRINNKLIGDVDFDNVQKVAAAITPVPGGIGPLTVEGLMEQVVALTERQYESRR